METRKHSDTYYTLADTKRFHFIRDVIKLILSVRNRMIKDNQRDFLIKRNLAIGCMFYLTAGRVSEVSELYIKDLKIYTNSLKHKFMSVDLVNRKNRTQTFKRVVSNFKNESFFINVIYDYYKMIVKMYNPKVNAKRLMYGAYDVNDNDYIDLLDKPLFLTYRLNKMKTITFRHMITKYYRMNTHTFRRIRLTHLVRHYKMNSKEIQNFAGHSSIESAEPYINITNRDFESKMSFSAR